MTAKRRRAPTILSFFAILIALSSVMFLHLMRINVTHQRQPTQKQWSVVNELGSFRQSLSVSSNVVEAPEGDSGEDGLDPEGDLSTKEEQENEEGERHLDRATIPGQNNEENIKDKKSEEDIESAESLGGTVSDQDKISLGQVNSDNSQFLFQVQQSRDRYRRKKQLLLADAGRKLSRNNSILSEKMEAIGVLNFSGSPAKATGRLVRKHLNGTTTTQSIIPLSPRNDSNNTSFVSARRHSAQTLLLLNNATLIPPLVQHTKKTRHVPHYKVTIGDKFRDIDYQRNNFNFPDPLLHPSNTSQATQLKPATQYLGLLLDAGRHYFPVKWIYNLVDYLHLLGFNLLHFRLTDDQAFNVRLDSRPELAQGAAGSNGTVYTPTELREIVAYAKSKGVSIMPEINVPGHAGAWAGRIPRIVVPCSGFICKKGYGVPLNVSHPDLIHIVRDVLTEIKDIFSTAPFFHLGGDEVEMSMDCFTELGIDMMDYSKFEEDMGNILTDLGIKHSQIARWEMTGQDTIKSIKTRIKGIDHFWMSRGYQNQSNRFPNVFCSQGLYFDTNQEDDAWIVYGKTRSMLEGEQNMPIAVVAATFELGVDYWVDRNVLGRLLAVAMGASMNLYQDLEEFKRAYLDYCHQIGLPHKLCSKLGAPLIEYNLWREHWAKYARGKWISDICERLTIRETIPAFIDNTHDHEINRQFANIRFWEDFAGITGDLLRTVSANKTTVNGHFGRLISMDRIKKHKVKHTGIILDLVEDGSFSTDKMMRLKAIIDYIADLGFNTLQLRIMTDHGFAIRLRSQELTYTFDHSESHTSRGFTSSYLMDQYMQPLIGHAAERGIQIIPELTVIHRAGGWINGVQMAPCPRHHCFNRNGLALNITNSDIFPILASVLRELRESFTSPFLHLGYDERMESTLCFEEALIEPNFDKYERRIGRLLEFLEIPEDMVLRWENEEQVLYDVRAGSITHYHKGLPSEKGGNYFLSTGLFLNDPSTPYETAWDLYLHIQNLTSYEPLGVLVPVVSFHDKLLAHLNVRQRLLAIAIGLSIENLNEAEFKIVFLELCRAANNRDCAEKGGKLRNQMAAKRYLEYTNERRFGNTCQSRLQNISVAMPIPGVLVEEGIEPRRMAARIDDTYNSY